MLQIFPSMFAGSMLTWSSQGGKSSLSAADALISTRFSPAAFSRLVRKDIERLTCEYIGRQNPWGSSRKFRRLFQLKTFHSILLIVVHRRALFTRRSQPWSSCCVCHSSTRMTTGIALEATLNRTERRTHLFLSGIRLSISGGCDGGSPGFDSDSDSPYCTSRKRVENIESRSRILASRTSYSMPPISAERFRSDPVWIQRWVEHGETLSTRTSG